MVTTFIYIGLYYLPINNLHLKGRMKNSSYIAILDLYVNIMFHKRLYRKEILYKTFMSYYFPFT